MLSRSRSPRKLGFTAVAAATLAASSPFVVSDGWGLVGSGVARGQQTQAPPPPSFSRNPTTPLETWEVADYLIRIGQPEQAAPFVKRFLDSNPDDATLLRIRDDSGPGTILRLADNPATAPYSAPIIDKVGKAAIRAATDPARLERFVAALRSSREEQAYAVDRLKEAGPYAVAPILRELSRPGLPNEDRTPYAENMGRLDRGAVPPLIAALESTDVRLVGDAARALGRIGDPRAVPALTYLAARRNPESVARTQAIAAIQEITDIPFGSQPKTPPKVLADEARRYHLHEVRFPGNQVVVWVWDEAASTPAPRIFSSRDAESYLGLQAARQALALDPGDITAQANLLALALDHDPVGSSPSALAAGPVVLSQVLRTAIADGRSDLAASAATLLGRVVDRDDLATGGRPDPLVESLSAPDRRVQFAAAEALVRLDPRRSFSGSSRVVPVLTRFLATQGVPRALVVDGNPLRGGQSAGFLRTIGYDAQVASTGAEGFALASGSADVELILTEANFVNDPWTLTDLLGNLKADGRTSGIPVVIVGPLATRNQIAASLESFPGARFAVTPTETALFGGQLNRIVTSLGVRPFTADERTNYAKRSSALLATIARSPGSPFEADLAAATPALGAAINSPIAPIEAAMILGDIPGQAAQRTLADAVLDTSRPAPSRLASADNLARSIRRFGRVVAPEQERRLLDELNSEADPAIRNALATIIGALRPTPDASGSRLQTYR